MDIFKLIEYAIEHNASDLHIGIEKPPMLRINGELLPVEGEEKLTENEARELIYSVLEDKHKAMFEEKRELDLSRSVRDITRIRMNVFCQKKTVGAAIRIIPNQVPSFDQLGLPPIVNDVVKYPNGLVLITGPTGTGKSTTLASMVDFINKSSVRHIVTVEDPIEFFHYSKNSIVHQREISSDTFSFGNALKYVLRQDPDVILVGEMRDRETIRASLNIAETGHLVFSTLHTSDATQTINRIIDVFPKEEQEQVRTQISFVLKAVFSQQLLPPISGKKRVLACEILISNSAICHLIREGKIEQIPTYIQGGKKFGMQTMNMALKQLYEQQKISYNDAFRYSPDKEGLQKMFGVAINHII